MVIGSISFTIKIIGNSIWTMTHAHSVTTAFVVTAGCVGLSGTAILIAILGMFLLYVAYKLPRMR